MDRFVKKFWLVGIAVLAAIVFVLGGCGQVMDSLNDNNENDSAFVAGTGITLSETSRVAGTEIDLNALAVVAPADATHQAIEWFVTDAGTTVVTVGAVAGGTVTPAAAGIVLLLTKN
jgi:hypothetical protein